ncbi:hypothetical protein GSI_07835 [Ganoderma sinense ZZ0214-1]|uniref:Uncharacterized protein n=1 Tax=Ganoderma sinense ZZ0214-1 TaxID=1077348 RepID=A0A2G8S851_9APHY|nr:hypothetical protein GSI_07835 [Ganoderma sinense ZZ0214-1]
MLNAKLNTDVFPVISEFLTDYSDVLSFSLVCSTLRRVAIRRLLSMRPVSLKGDLSVRRFHTFLFASAVIRAPVPHVRALRIGGFKLPPWKIANEAEDSPSPLVDIINSCPNLEHIAMCFANGSTDDESSVVAAIAALKTLSSLEVSGWSGNTLDLLHDISSPLRKLAIHSGYIRSPYALDEFLPRLAPSLEDLELMYFRVHRGSTLVALDDEAPGPDGHPQPFRSLAQYPAVRSFSAIILIGAPVLDRLQHLFPALNGTLSLGDFDTTINRCSEDAIRAANRRAQDAAPERAWKKLDRVVCDARMLYALALRCPVRLVMIDKGSAGTLCFVADALRENPVPRLKLTLKYGRGMLDGVFTPELAATLTHLTLCLVYSNTDRWGMGGGADDFAQLLWDDLLGTLLSALQPLHNLTHLRVLIYCRLRKPQARDADWPRGNATYSEKFVDAVRGPAFDFTGTAAALVRALPASKYVFLTTYGSFVERGEAARSWRAYERWDASRAWRVADDSDEPGMGADGVQVQDGASICAGRLVELHSDVADTIIWKEELVLSETDECCLFPKEK